MSNIFLSHSYADLEIAQSLERRLIAKDHRTRIPVGSAVAGNWRIKYTKALAAADALVVLLSESALESKNVLGEVGAGRVLEQARGMLLLPVLLGGMPIPGFISDLYCFRLRTTDEAQQEALVEELNKAITDNVKLGPRIFISHRHRDKEIAQALTQLLEQAFVIGRNDIRCTSVQLYMLTPGERTSEQLRSDIGGAELVIGLLSPDISESNYVLCELGASWGRDVATFPVLVRGARPGDVPSPLNERHSISLQAEENCLQLVSYVESKTSLTRRAVAPASLAGPARVLADLASGPVDVAAEWEHVYTKTYTGPVWIKLQQSDAPHASRFEIVMVWGVYTYVADLPLAPNGFVYLRDRKRNADMVPLRVRISPACQVSFGEGEPPSDPVFSIEHKWGRLEEPANY